MIRGDGVVYGHGPDGWALQVDGHVYNEEGRLIRNESPSRIVHEAGPPMMSYGDRWAHGCEAAFGWGEGLMMNRC